MTEEKSISEYVELTLPDASLLLWENFLPRAEADALFAIFRDQIKWQREVAMTS